MAHLPRIAVASVALVLAAAGWAQTPSTGAWHDAAGASGDTRAPSASVVTLQRRAVQGGIELLAENRLAGPVEVLIRVHGDVPRSDPPFPVRATLPAHGRAVVARLGDGTGHSTLHVELVPGAPGARHRDVEYVYPLRGAPLRITQGFDGGFSHTDDENRYAVDFAVDEGTPVLAARDGVVMQAESAVATSGRGPTDDTARTNFVRILHDDGTMALYAHLQRGGIIVAAGERVRRGQIVAFSGNTGASTGPHLHFAVHANQGLRLQSLPFRMFGPRGILRFTAPDDRTRD